MSAERPPLDPDLAAAPVYTAGTSVEEVARKYGLSEIVKLASNESPLGASPRAIAAIKAAAKNLHRYPAMADDALRAKIAARLGEGIGPEHVATANGGTEVLAFLAQGFLAKGDEAILCPPTFPIYEIFVRRRGARPVVCPLRTPGHRYDVDAILKAVTPATRLVFLCSPVNPTGTLLLREDADRLIASLPERVIAVMDESYCDFVDDPAAADALPHVRAGRSVIAVRSFSKSYGLAGLRVGYAVARPDLAQYLWRTRNPFHIGALALAGALAALDDDRHLARIRKVVLSGRKHLYRELKKRGLSPISSQANFVLFKPGCPPEAVYERLMAKGVIIRPAAFFYVPDGIRVTVGTRAENLRFLAALDEVLPELRKDKAP